MAFSYEKTVAAGGSALVSVPFPYIAKTHVTLHLNGVLQTGYTWLNDQTIQMGGPIAGGTAQLVRRTTPADEPLVTFVKGQFDESDLNLSELQSLYLHQEDVDNLGDLKADFEDFEGSFDDEIAAAQAAAAAAEVSKDAAVAAVADAEAALADTIVQRGLAEDAATDASTAEDAAVAAKVLAQQAVVDANAVLLTAVRLDPAGTVTNPDTAPAGQSYGTSTAVDAVSRGWQFYTAYRTGGTTDGTQTAISDTLAGAYYFRKKTSGTWSAWSEVNLTPGMLAVTGYAGLKAVDPAVTTLVYVSAAGRSGTFEWSAGDASGVAPNDLAEGVYVASTVLPTTSGMWVRRYWGDVQAAWFGVLVDGSSMDVQFGRFLTFLTVWNVPGRLPNGKITMANALSLNIGSANLSVTGGGKGVSVIEFAGTTGGITIQHTAPGGGAYPALVRFKSFTLLTTAAGAHTNALAITYSPTSASAVLMPLEIDDLEIKGDNPATHFWANGIVLTDEWNSRITNCLIKGLDDSTSPFDMGPGIHLIRCNDCRVLSNHIYHAEYGIRMLSDVPSYGDGALIQDNRIVGVTYGVYITGSNVVAQVGICYNHINANGACITLDSCSYTPIVGNLLFKTHTSTLNDWSCILLTGTSNDNAISGNNMSTPGAAAVASNFGIFIAGGFRNTITNNHFTNFTGTTNYPLYHGGGGGHTVATSNMCDTTMSATFNTGGGGTVDEANNKRA